MSARQQFIGSLTREQRERHVRQQREESEVLDTFIRRQPRERRLRAERQILTEAPPQQDEDDGLFSLTLRPSAPPRHETGTRATVTESGTVETEQVGQDPTRDVNIGTPKFPETPNPDDFAAPIAGAILAVGVLLGGLWVLGQFAKGFGRGKAA